LDHDKPILKQVGSPHELNFRFGVKFYIQDPALLEEELTRYGIIFSDENELYI
jgi:hypothetical protein